MQIQETTMLIKPHGGVLINRMITGDAKERLEERCGGMERIQLHPREVSDLDMIAVGAFSPLTGFMCQVDYLSVIEYGRLPRGLPWTIPITLGVDKKEADRYKPGEDIALYDSQEHLLGVLHLQEKYLFDKEKEARQVLLTTDIAHPGVKYLMEMGEVLLGGAISLINRPLSGPFERYRLDPIETRILFKEKGWSKVVAFQTRNPIHRAHEYIQKCALETVEGLLLHPLMGETKSDDIPAEVRMDCYNALLKDYYPKERVVMSIFPAAMRYAGPKEAIFHAIARKNYGCSHFIVGRDHAGVGHYYGTYDAQRIFDNYSREEIDIVPLCFEHAFYCKRCDEMASTKTCPHPEKDRIALSGTAVRKMLREGIRPPAEFTRPEVADILIKSMQ
jgi:sulfate adenylyltransferase